MQLQRRGLALLALRVETAPSSPPQVEERILRKVRLSLRSVRRTRLEGEAAPMLRPRDARPVIPQYAAGSPLSVGLATAFLKAALIGTLRLMPLGGIGFWNHFS